MLNMLFKHFTECFKLFTTNYIWLSFVFEKKILLQVKALSFYFTTPIFVKIALQESYLILFNTKNEISVIPVISFKQS